MRKFAVPELASQEQRRRLAVDRRGSRDDDLGDLVFRQATLQRLERQIFGPYPFERRK